MENCRVAARPRSAVHKGFLLGRVAERENTLSQTASFRERGAGGPAVSISLLPTMEAWTWVPGLHPSLDST